MKALIKASLLLFFITAAIINAYVFVSGISLSERITNFEQETKKLHAQNIDLEKQVFEDNSLSHIASEAADLEFTKKIEPAHLDNLQYALRK